MSLLVSVLSEEGAGVSGNTPLDYGDDLRLFLDAENGIVTSGSNVTSWTDQDAGRIFDVPGGGQSPQFEASSQNGLPGVNFQQPIGDTFLNRKLADPAPSVDNHFGSGSASIAFAGKLNRLTATQFNPINTIVNKGFNVGAERGFDVNVQPDGTFRFRHKRSNGSTWQIEADGFYKVGDLVLGYVVYDGGNTSGSGTVRLYDGSNFVSVGAVSVGTSSGIGSDAADDLVIGNLRDPDNSSFNQPFEGPLFAVWFTRPANNSFDESYLQRWIP